MKFTYPAEKAIELRWLNWNVGRHLADRDRQAQYIEFRREKYPYPDYPDLVRLPLDEHFDKDGELTIERKAQLMLIGVFQWKGMFIAKAENCNTKEDRGWLVVPKYDEDTPLSLYSDRLKRQYKEQPRITGSVQEFDWVAQRKRNGKMKNERIDFMFNGGYFDPFNKLKPQRLERLMVNTEGCSVRYSVYFKDQNPYNCFPDNLVAVEGRKRRCAKCGVWILKEQSKEIRDTYGSRTRRWYCLHCLGEN